MTPHHSATDDTNYHCSCSRSHLTSGFFFLAFCCCCIHSVFIYFFLLSFYCCIRMALHVFILQFPSFALLNGKIYDFITRSRFFFCVLFVCFLCGSFVRALELQFSCTPLRHFRYPKPGTPNPTVKLRVADIADPKSVRTRDLLPPPLLMNE